MTEPFIPYSEITYRQKQFLFHFVIYLAKLLDPQNKERVVYYRAHSCPMGKSDLKRRTSYGLKHDLDPANRCSQSDFFLKYDIFEDYRDFERFYCRNDTFKQAMLDCHVKYKKADHKGVNWRFLGGFQDHVIARGDDVRVAYEEITAREKEFLFFLVQWWAETFSLPWRRMKKVIPRAWFTRLEKDPMYTYRHVSACSQETLIKSLLETGDAKLIFDQYPEFSDFEAFYCRKHSVQQAMLDLKVKIKKTSEYEWLFVGGFESDHTP